MDIVAKFFHDEIKTLFEPAKPRAGTQYLRGYPGGVDFATALGKRGKLLTASVASFILTYMDEHHIHEQHMVHHMLYHIIFCPKRRKKVLVGPVRDHLEQITHEIPRTSQGRRATLASSMTTVR